VPQRLLKQFELNLPPGPAQKSFLDHFNSQLRLRMPGAQGHAGYQDDVFVASFSGPFFIHDLSVVRFFETAGWVN